MSPGVSALTRLRIAFATLGVALLVAIGFLLHSSLSRLDAQRVLRHRMVAERVFDEAEQEIGNLLQHEAKRPAAAYDAVDTEPARWAPFVVGYYRREPALSLVAESRISNARRARVRRALATVVHTFDSRPAASFSPLDDDERNDPQRALGQRSSPDVLRQLNRSVKVRERRERKLTQSFEVVAADPGTLVFERKSPDGDRREGFVLDVPSFVSTIQSWVLTAQGLDAVATLAVRAPRGQAPANVYDFGHALAAPMQSVRVWLRVTRLDDDDASTTLVGLASLLTTAALAGLLALYRMVAVQILFAERRNNFVAAVTHELKTPLTAIRMYGEMLRDDMAPDDATRREYVATITAEGERLTRLINNVMEHARLRRGERRLQLVRTNVAEVVRDVLELLAPHIEREGFALTLDVAQAPCPARCDVDAFKQVLWNVLDNALKYGRSAERPSPLHVSCSTDGERVLVRIRDFGPGIAEHQLPHVFEPFFRGQDELTRRKPGTGIGLSLVRDLVAGMDGQVTASNAHPGVEIVIALQKAPAAPAAAGAPSLRSQ